MVAEEEEEEEVEEYWRMIVNYIHIDFVAAADLVLSPFENLVEKDEKMMTYVNLEDSRGKQMKGKS